MGKFKPILRKPGEVIRSEDWNRMQEEILGDIQELESKLQRLKDYIDSMEQTETMLNMVSPVGTSYSLNEAVPGEDIIRLSGGRTDYEAMDCSKGVRRGDLQVRRGRKVRVDGLLVRGREWGQKDPRVNMST